MDTAEDRKLPRRALLCSLPAALGAAALAAERRPEPKRILILGGTGFLGPATVEAARARGHKLTLFNRGKTRPGLFSDIEQLHGDRDPKIGEGIRALEGREWDAVIDNSGYYPRMVAASASLLAPKVKQYIFISTCSVYVDNATEGQDETAKLATIPDPTVETMGKQFENYGALKALSEQAAEKAMPGRVANIRPGYIVGPDDPSGRFTYWPVRADRGGEIAAPGSPKDPIQFIDVRDLGEWLVRLVEQCTVGVFNAIGPAKRLEWGKVLDACLEASGRKAKLEWVSADFVSKQKGFEFPIWAAYAGETRGFHTFSIRRALKAGLRCRPYPATVRDTLAWYKGQGPQGRVKLAGPTAEQEAALLAAWHSRKS